MEKLMRLLLTCSLLLLVFFVVTLAEARADTITITTSTVFLDASTFTPGTTYYVAFQLTGGGTDNNSVLITNFNFGGGSVLNQDPADPTFGTFVVGPNSLDPAGIGQTLASLQLTITPGDAFSLYTQQLVAGSSLSFDFTLTNNFVSGSFDQFAFQIYDAGLSTLLFERTFDITGAETVPEPATVVLMGMGLFGASAYLRRRRVR
jgi:hypothetical protein